MKSKKFSPELESKLERLRRILRRTEGCAVAYSGGVDSSLLLAAAREVLGERCLAVIGVSRVNGKREQEAALRWLEQAGIPHRVVKTRELANAKFCANPENRCYYCKRGLFRQILREAKRAGLPTVAEGSNVDDRKQVRPGRQAMEELGILRPLEQAGLNKADIRELARMAYRLPMADKPSNPCLASRFAFGVRITPERLRRVEHMEDYLRNQGFHIVRARFHPEVLRLELGAEEERRLLQPKLRRAVVDQAKELGFVQVTLDLQGFRSGSAHDAPRMRRIEVS